MGRLHQLAPQSVLFVSGENSNVYYHVSGLMMLDAADRPDFGFDVFRDHLASRIAAIPQFRWRLHEVPLGLDLPYWVEDDEFDLDVHIRRIAVPSPGDREALGRLVSYLYSRHLDRHRPLWETWFIEGLEDGRFAMFMKVHHAMLDGQAAAKMMELISDLEPDAPPRPVDPAITQARAGDVPTLWEKAVNATWHLSAFPIRAGREIFDVARSSSRAPRGRSGGDRGRPPTPKSRLNRDITGRRGFVFGSLPLDDVKAIKDHFGVTVNDVVLAVVGGSLRSYLLDLDELPERSLRASIAVSLRTAEHDEFGNQVTTATVGLATDLDDPVARLRAIAADTDQAKRHARSGAKGLLELVAVLPAPLVSAVTAVIPTEVTFQLAHTNVIVSSVRGAPVPLYLAGARTTAMYPMSIITTGGGLNVTCMSYANAIDVGITTEPRLVPEPWAIVDAMADELAAYRDMLPSRSRQAGRTRNRTAQGRT